MKHTAKFEHKIAHYHNAAVDKLLVKIRLNDWALLSVEQCFKWDAKQDENNFKSTIMYDDGRVK